ncbi:MAG: hypothetical protein J2P45_28090, partial [Candidatus Dormibacteraeota bacterium]|nr:hypothetical protein [Candidatus Dormibacteraeota bacterium]
MTCSYLVFVLVIAAGVLAGSDGAATKAAMISGLAFFIAAYVAFWYTSMTDRGWTCDFTWTRTGLAVAVCAVSVGLALVRFQTFGYLLIFCAVLLPGLLPPRTGWIAVLGAGAATVLLIYATHVPPIDWFWLPITATLSGLGVTFGRRMN